MTSLASACVLPVGRLAALLLLLLLSNAAQAAPEIRHWQTESGMRVYFVQADDLPMLDLRLLFDAGSARDGDLPGLARLTSAMLPQGAGSHDADAIARAFEEVGARFSSGSGKDQAWLSLRSLSDPAYLQPALQNFIRVLSEPTFPRRDFRRLLDQARVAMKAIEADPAALAERAFIAALYRQHPYATPTLGTKDAIERIKLRQLRAFYQRHYVTRNALLVMVGALDETQARELAERLASALPQGERAAALPPVEPLRASEEIRIDFPSRQAHVLIGGLGIERGNPDFFPLLVGNHVLGGGGFTSRLVDEVRQKRGFAYSVYSYFSPMRQRGGFIVGMQTRGNQVDEAIAVVEQSLRSFVAEGPQRQELEAAVANIAGGFPLRVASNASILEYLAAIGFYELPLDYLQTYIEQVEAVTLPSIGEAFRRTVNPDHLIKVVVGGSES